VAAKTLPLAETDNPKVARATEGAAPNNPANVFGLKSNPSVAKLETTQPPMMNLSNSSLISKGF